MNTQRLGVIVLALAAASSCGKGSSTPTAPTVAAPPGCSGTAVERIEVSFSVTGGLVPGGVKVQLFDKTFDRQMAIGDRFVVTEDVVPCNYEIVGQMLGQNLSIGFGRTPPFKDFSGSVDKGVEKGSVVIVEGPNGVVSSSGNCRVDYRVAVGGSGGMPPPSDIKIRFRVSNSNAISGMGGGCG